MVDSIHSKSNPQPCAPSSQPETLLDTLVGGNALRLCLTELYSPLCPLLPFLALIRNDLVFAPLRPIACNSGPVGRGYWRHRGQDGKVYPN